MSEIAETPSPQQVSEPTCGSPPSRNRSILWLQIITIGWMLLECAVSLVSAKTACSPSLLAFGSDSLVELLSATVVLLQFVPRIRLNSARAGKAAGKTAGNRALTADAVQSATCAYLAAITLVGLATNALFHIQWVDSVAALIAVPLLIREAKAAIRGEGCACC